MTGVPDPRVLAALARHELRILLRSRWVPLYGAVFAVLVLGVSYFGLAVVELTGFQRLDRTAVSLLSLVLYIVPLATMLMTVQSFRPEGGVTEQLLSEPLTTMLMTVQSFRPEGGVTEQLLSEPLTASEVVLGKLLGLAGAHGLATVFGFGFAGVLIAAKGGTAGLGSYLVLVGFTLVVGLVFLSLASLLTLLAGRAVRAYALVLVVWFVMVLLFDLLVIGVSFLLPEVWANRLALGGVFLNPVDAARVGALLSISGREMFGPAGAQLVRALGGVGWAVASLVGSLVAWVVVGAAGAVGVLRRMDS